MSERIYKKFISNTIASFPLITPREWVNFMLKFDVTKESQVKDMALILYYARVASFSNCDSMDHFLNINDYQDIKKYIKEIEKLKKDNGLTLKQIEYYTTDEQAIKHMKEFEDGEMSFEELLESGKPKKNTVKSPKAQKVKKSKSRSVESPKKVKKTKTSESPKAQKVKKTKAPESPKAQKVKKDKLSKSIESPKAQKVKKSKALSDESPKAQKVKKSKVRSDESPKVKKKRQTLLNTSKVKSGGTLLVKKKDCNSSTIAELRKLASQNNVHIPSGLKKPEICKIVGDAGLLDVVVKKNCNKYTIADLRKLASENDVHIPSGLKKMEICEIVKDAGLLDIIIPTADNTTAEKKFVKSHYIYNTDEIIIGTKKSGKYSPLTVEDRLLLAKLKIPYKFATNQEIEKLFFFADVPQNKIAYNELGNTNPGRMTRPPVPLKDRAPQKVRKDISPTEVFQKKQIRNATKNAKFEKKFEDRQLLPKRI